MEVATAVGGLDSREVAERIADGRVNRTTRTSSRSVKEIIRTNVFTFFNLIVGSLFVVMLIVGPVQDALFGIVAIANTLIGIIQEVRAKRSLERLSLVGRPRVVAIRDGVEQDVEPEDVVLDDLVVLASGAQLAVDGVIVDDESLEIDESLLTGESDPIEKQPGDTAMSGSFVVAGRGTMRVTAVGDDSYAAKLGDQASRFTMVRSQIRDDINRVLRLVTWALIPISILLAISQVRDSETWQDAISGTVAGIITMIPEGLVLLTSIAFAVGVVTLGRQGCLVQELAAVEGLARVDVVCADKTGTLTEDRMEVVEIVPSGPADDDRGSNDAESLSDESVRQVLAALAHADQSPNASMAAIGQACDTDPGWTPTAVAAFSSARKWSGVSFGADGDWVIGAPEILLDAAAATGTSSDDPNLVAARRFADQGLRVLLVARAAASVDRADDIRPVRPVGLVVLAQAVRPDSGATLDYFRQQGVIVKVISGDDPRTVGAIALRLGLEQAEHPVDARTMPTFDPESGADDPQRAAFAEIVAGNSVFGRVTPHQKRAMVGSLQAAGRTVAMTGDGVNDVLALKDADIGVAMGSGSDATRSVAQLVLLENKFAVLPSVVAEGRKVIGNIERVAKLFLTKSVYGAIMAVSIGILQAPFPFLPRHLTVVTALTIGIPAFLLALAPNRDVVAPNMVARVLRFSVPAGAIASAAALFAFMVSRNSDGTTLTQDRTAATIALFLVGMGALVAVARPLVLWKVLMIAALNVAFVLAMMIEFVYKFFAFEIANSRDVWVAIAVGLAGAVAVIGIGSRTIPAQD